MDVQGVQWRRRAPLGVGKQWLESEVTQGNSFNREHTHTYIQAVAPDHVSGVYLLSVNYSSPSVVFSQ